MQNRHVLIVGASGLVGSAAANSFIAAGWQVTTASRRAPEWVTGEYQHVTLDLTSESDCGAVARLGNITHLVYTSVYELPGLVAGWSDPEQITTNDRMLRNLLGTICEHNPLTHVTLLQGTKAYGASVAPMRVPAREHYPRVEHANFYWLQEDYVRELSPLAGFDFTILRPQLIVGPNYGVVMNLPPVIGAYAAIRSAEGLPFSYPGGADWVWEAVDARLVGDACVWAAGTDQAWGETFNLTNGEVFSFRDMWPALASSLGVEVGTDEPMDLAEYLTARSGIWDQIVSQYDLQPNSLAQILGESHHYANLCLNCGGEVSPPPTFVSTVKIRNAGFNAAMNTEESFCHWLTALQTKRVLPTY